MSSKSSKFPYVILILAFIMIGFGAYNLNKMPDSKYPNFNADFSLHSGDKSVSFSDLSGKVSVVFFGYTHCPDVCPATLVNFGKALKMLDEDERNLVRAVFISLDHDRDTPETVQKYTNFFHPDIIGLTGDDKEVAAAAKSFMVPNEKNKPNAKGNYTMNHGTYLYIIRPDGKLGELASHKDSAEKIVASLRKWIKWAE
ncbi:protein SCO1/2 [Mariprofundus micogutta]|uniref:Protein SCO1/2 n=1 Tax=Mariprofundus micogutta TaxID=1921010 RepID=A0A1L8CKE4_9PROT|nr:SCO family protein [Mariprofundus micogutta]GAV19382.1 protein SCO1/2 [Mariprofundus micogutta]